jgi:hypothetical protein
LITSKSYQQRRDKSCLTPIGAKKRSKEQFNFQRQELPKMPIPNIYLQKIIAMFIQLLGSTFHFRIENLWLLNLIAVKQTKSQKPIQARKESFLLTECLEHNNNDGGDGWGQFVDLMDEHQSKTRRKMKAQ